MIDALFSVTIRLATSRLKQAHETRSRASHARVLA
jgi:hypothetical protein